MQKDNQPPHEEISPIDLLPEGESMGSVPDDEVSVATNIRERIREMVTAVPDERMIRQAGLTEYREAITEGSRVSTGGLS